MTASTVKKSLAKAVAELFLRPRASMQQREEEYQKMLSDFLKNRTQRHTGKTARKRASGYHARHAARRSAHEGWMHAVASNPNGSHPHPFHT